MICMNEAGSVEWGWDGEKEDAKHASCRSFAR